MSLPSLDTHEFCRRADSASGQEPLADLSRVASLLADPGGALSWQIAGRSAVRADGSRLAFLSLELQATVIMRCVRCLEPVAHTLFEQRAYRLVSNESQAAQEDAEDDDYDILVASRRFDLGALIEDEVIMALPAAPRHEHCEAPATVSRPGGDSSAGSASVAEPAAEHPFAVLSGLKRPTR